ncbi:uncharacterized protein LOC127881901 isoform X2 [Dreissena polymorpha]|uniref:uncharacterized protein LOC127881901 isoform X2 n=1 Tax=Dreissena polymorpha TaxID=45954 RepID=UPI0022654125|nr:uncharacterized protein LOC127881901 isoform X2 [Dreissena polymorpha]
MSCFGGRMKEYDRVSLDRFDSKNLQSTVYLLSHLHEDHTVGLGEPLFFRRLKSNTGVFLYCSEVTEALLLASRKYCHLKPYIKCLPINTPTTIEIPEPLYDHNECITVTLLPAFHCPGSVMFLLEGKEGTVLYTGDFRWEHFDIEQMVHLRSGEGVKKIKSLYVDTTFLSPTSLHIPSRAQCIDAVTEAVREWTSKSPGHVVYMNLRAQYGHEPLLTNVATRLNRKVHVRQQKFDVYNTIQETDGHFTDDGRSTQLHACDKYCTLGDDENCVEFCKDQHDADKVLVILPTTMYFTQFKNVSLDMIVKKMGDNFYRACYSFHSSYTEVAELLAYLKPDAAYANVKAPSDLSLAETQARLNALLESCCKPSKGSDVGWQNIYSREPGGGDNEGQEVGTRALGTLRTRATQKRKPRVSTSDVESLDFGSPAKQQKTAASSSQGSPSSMRQTRGRGRGRSQASTPPAVATRRSTRQSAKTIGQEETQVTPTKEVKARPETPVSRQDSSEPHSSDGSPQSDSELDLVSSQTSGDSSQTSHEARSWAGGSFLAAVSSYSDDDDEQTGRVCLLDDDEHCDDTYQDVSQVEGVVSDEEEGLTLDDIIASSSVEKHGRSSSSDMKLPAEEQTKPLEDKKPSKSDSGDTVENDLEKVEDDLKKVGDDHEKVADDLEKVNDDLEMVDDLDKAEDDLKKVENDLKKVPDDLDKVDDLHKVENDLKKVGHDRGKIEDDLEKMDDDLDKIEDALEKVDDDFDKVNDLDKVADNLEKIEDDLENIHENNEMQTDNEILLKKEEDIVVIDIDSNQSLKNENSCDLFIESQPAALDHDMDYSKIYLDKRREASGDGNAMGNTVLKVTETQETITIIESQAAALDNDMNFSKFDSNKRSEAICDGNAKGNKVLKMTETQETITIIESQPAALDNDINLSNVDSEERSEAIDDGNTKENTIIKVTETQETITNAKPESPRVAGSEDGVNKLSQQPEHKTHRLEVEIKEPRDSNDVNRKRKERNMVDNKAVTDKQENVSRDKRHDAYDPAFPTPDSPISEEIVIIDSDTEEEDETMDTSEDQCEPKCQEGHESPSSDETNYHVSINSKDQSQESTQERNSDTTNGLDTDNSDIYLTLENSQESIELVETCDAQGLKKDIIMTTELENQTDETNKASTSIVYEKQMKDNVNCSRENANKSAVDELSKDIDKTCNNATSPEEHAEDPNKSDAKEKQKLQIDDDVIEIVDLTGDDFGPDKETLKQVSKGRKKPIKISFGKSNEQILKEKLERESKRKRLEHDSSDSESDSEWLSSAKGNEHRSKRQRQKKPKKTEMELKEMEEKNELKRQAMGFVCETDSDSELESSEPESPTGSVLYDEFVELSSGDDSDKEDGNSSKGLRTSRKNSQGEISNGNRSSHGSSGGWLNTSRGGRQRECEPQREDNNENAGLSEHSDTSSEKNSEKNNESGVLISENLTTGALFENDNTDNTGDVNTNKDNNENAGLSEHSDTSSEKDSEKNNESGVRISENLTTGALFENENTDNTGEENTNKDNNENSGLSKHSDTSSEKDSDKNNKSGVLISGNLTTGALFENENMYNTSEVNTNNDDVDCYSKKDDTSKPTKEQIYTREGITNKDDLIEVNDTKDDDFEINRNKGDHSEISKENKIGELLKKKENTSELNLIKDSSIEAKTKISVEESSIDKILEIQNAVDLNEPLPPGTEDLPLLETSLEKIKKETEVKQFQECFFQFKKPSTDLYLADKSGKQISTIIDRKPAQSTANLGTFDKTGMASNSVEKHRSIEEKYSRKPPQSASHSGTLDDTGMASSNLEKYIKSFAEKYPGFNTNYQTIDTTDRRMVSDSSKKASFVEKTKSNVVPKYGKTTSFSTMKNPNTSSFEENYQSFETTDSWMGSDSRKTRTFVEEKTKSDVVPKSSKIKSFSAMKNLKAVRKSYQHSINIKSYRGKAYDDDREAANTRSRQKEAIHGQHWTEAANYDTRRYADPRPIAPVKTDISQLKANIFSLTGLELSGTLSGTSSTNPQSAFPKPLFPVLSGPNPAVPFDRPLSSLTQTSSLFTGPLVSSMETNRAGNETLAELITKLEEVKKLAEIVQSEQVRGPIREPAPSAQYEQNRYDSERPEYPPVRYQGHGPEHEYERYGQRHDVEYVEPARRLPPDNPHYDYRPSFPPHRPDPDAPYHARRYDPDPYMNKAEEAFYDSHRAYPSRGRGSRYPDSLPPRRDPYDRRLPYDERRLPYERPPPHYPESDPYERDSHYAPVEVYEYANAHPAESYPLAGPSSQEPGQYHDRRLPGQFHDIRSHGQYHDQMVHGHQQMSSNSPQGVTRGKNKTTYIGYVTETTKLYGPKTVKATVVSRKGQVMSVSDLSN